MVGRGRAVFHEHAERYDRDHLPLRLRRRPQHSHEKHPLRECPPLCFLGCLCRHRHRHRRCADWHELGHWPLIPLQPNHRLLETGTPERFGRLLAYHNDSADRGGGVPVDTLFDAFLFSGDDWYGGKNIWPFVGHDGMNMTVSAPCTRPRLPELPGAPPTILFSFCTFSF